MSSILIVLFPPSVHFTSEIGWHASKKNCTRLEIPHVEPFLGPGGGGEEIQWDGSRAKTEGRSEAMGGTLLCWMEG